MYGTTRTSAYVSDSHTRPRQARCTARAIRAPPARTRAPSAPSRRSARCGHRARKPRRDELAQMRREPAEPRALRDSACRGRSNASPRFAYSSAHRATLDAPEQAHLSDVFSHALPAFPLRPLRSDRPPANPRSDRLLVRRFSAPHSEEAADSQTKPPVRMTWLAPVKPIQQRHSRPRLRAVAPAPPGAAPTDARGAAADVGAAARPSRPTRSTRAHARRNASCTASTRVRRRRCGSAASRPTTVLPVSYVATSDWRGARGVMRSTLVLRPGLTALLVLSSPRRTARALRLLATACTFTRRARGGRSRALRSTHSAADRLHARSRRSPDCQTTRPASSCGRGRCPSIAPTAVVRGRAQCGSRRCAPSP